MLRLVWVLCRVLRQLLTLVSLLLAWVLKLIGR